jgi:phosphoribosylformimino-5-aminoimidazole carboxamide ribotide isomerase
VVDLFQGDYGRETVYEDAAEAVAERFVTAGARWIHVVDLDGSRGGLPENRAIVRRIALVAARGGARLELGGGIRSVAAARAALEAGATRVVFGTVAVEQPEVVADAVSDLGADRVVVGIDARGRTVATRGWVQESSLTAVALARRAVDSGAERLIYTDITRDSTLTEPNFAVLEELRHVVSAALIASGGITTAAQIARLAGLGMEGAIVGSALYAGKLTLEAALQAAKGAVRTC